ncbi:ZIP family manganese transporter TmpA [Streptococcus sanguinis]|uniref:Metal cation transporter, ZIP family n=1 Tax=Streptococcus sanguinis SK353 TaxID=888815 RepID=F0FBN0_STRSA|nr:ZIP family manganese transporter TmpA [Streptococcus sanguinis]EGC23576.1 metal cation transporter, ZIP family [Streptococcus sanguinis SK353]
MDWLRSQPVVMQAFLAGLFTWGCTIVGSAVVFFFKQVSRKLLDIMMGFAAGVMIAASFWSLLAPSIEYAQSSYGKLSWLPAAIGFLVGGFFLRLIDAVVPHLHLSKDISEAESVPEHSRKKLSKTALLFLAITIHNFPEGLAVGVAFGALAANPSPEAFVGAIGLALGIGLQNVPEGAALSIPIRTDGKSRLKAFYWGSMSAIAEPIGAVLGAVAVMAMTAILPYALSFAAGAMIFVVVEELIPDSQSNGNTDVATLGLMVGFVLMMVLDVALG